MISYLDFKDVAGAIGCLALNKAEAEAVGLDFNQTQTTVSTFEMKLKVLKLKISFKQRASLIHLRLENKTQLTRHHHRL